MRKEWAAPFAEVVQEVLSTMAFSEVTSGKLQQKNGNKTFGDVTGIISMVGSHYTGSLVLSYEESTILGIVSNMFGEAMEELSQDVVDAVGELTNIISARMRKELSEQFNIMIEMATPAMIVGKGKEMGKPLATPVYIIPFKTNDGRFVGEFSLSTK